MTARLREPRRCHNYVAGFAGRSRLRSLARLAVVPELREHEETPKALLAAFEGREGLLGLLLRLVL